MPTVSVGRESLFQALGRKYTEEEFEDPCFNFGIELDDLTTEKAIIRKEKHLEEEESSEYAEVVGKNEVNCACLEHDYLETRFSNEKTKNGFRYYYTSKIRPFVVCAILRGVTFDETRYNSFIDLQDRLHQNICRRRTLVAIGMHDLDTVEGSFTYEALPPPEINFVPLKQTKKFRADELMDFYKTGQNVW